MKALALGLLGLVVLAGCGWSVGESVMESWVFFSVPLSVS